VWLTLIVATLCGLISVRADLILDPIRAEAPSRSEKVIWSILFVPPLLLLSGASIYTALHAHDGMDVVKAAAGAWLFACVLGFTVFMLRGLDSRARVEG
jgi:hypothetical protein